MRTLLLVLVALAAPQLACAFSFELEARKMRCFTEELPTGFEVNVAFIAAPGYAQLIDFKITDPKDVLIHDSQAQDKGSYKFITTQGGDHAFCFYSRLVSGVKYQDGMKRTIAFELKTGSETVDYKSIAKAEHLKPMEVALRMVEDQIRTIHSEYTYFKLREIEMRDTNEYMNTRVMFATILTMVFISLFALWQVRHLKSFFRKKKMID